ncbi:restriction endonuclease PLD domain-containing protein [Corynebacterium cystitidis]|uniref:restriction endonuclease PLD domain-containing protein n=1 Tax=Corynebacterium cystitidis TaxID=35757 RepID=UPI00211DE81A|nr:restriction endonuclease PLD domain-containing protein [Corynebacterium cystitidis]
MTLVFDSSHPKDKNRTFRKVFWNEADQSEKIEIAVGYIDTASIARLREYLRRNPTVSLKLLIGMQYLDGFTRPQLKAVRDLHSELKQRGTGQVLITESIRYHGKVYVFWSGGKVRSAYIGSGNLSAISDEGRQVFETGIVIDDDLEELVAYLKQRIFPLGTNLDEVASFSLKQSPSPLEGMDDATPTGQAPPPELISDVQPTYQFELPLKTETKSNLNVFFGKGRVNKKTGRELPRPWYEVEIIVPKDITSQPGYPVAGKVFTVWTHDGFSFECKISGANRKNFRSAKSLSTLGSYIKGWLESEELLAPGQMVTDEILRLYGRDTLGLYYFEETNRWILDFRADGNPNK